MCGSIMNVWSLLFSSVVIVVSAYAQPYDIPSFTIIPKNGTIAGGDFVVTGIVVPGRSVAVSGGDYSIVPRAFSSVIAVQTAEFPLLSLKRIDATTIRLTWSDVSGGFGLERSAQLGSGTWFGLVIPPTVDGPLNSVTLPIDNGTTFFRLKRLP